jgi:DNA recombination protein RmuC
METFLFLIVGLVAGLVIGWLVGGRKKTAADGSNDLAPQLNQAQVDLAGAQATVAAYSSQIAQLQAQIREGQENQAKENKLVNELAPVKENLRQMQEAVGLMQKERTEQVTQLNEAIRQSLESDQQLRKQTESLANALGSNQIRGVWGEAQLRKLVELAGLLKHADFDEQATITTGRADMIINLPGGKTLAIDSKVPFNSYQEASKISQLAEGADKARREQLVKEHAKAVRGHIDTLAGKAYWTSLNASPDFVIAFIPSEALLSAALDADPAILEYAFGKNVALASPVSLFSVLKTINFIWRQNVDENQVRKMLEIGRELYERVNVVAGLADALGRSIKSTVGNYNKFVASFESRMLVSARKLNDLDDSSLSVAEIESPAVIDDAPKQITAAELPQLESADDGAQTSN